MRDYKGLCNRLLVSDDTLTEEDKRFYHLKDICMEEYHNRNLVVPIGRINSKENVFLDFSSVSGLFIGGATGTGKSIMIDDIIVSLILKNNSHDVKFVFLEPYSVELGEYNGINYIYNNPKESVTKEKKTKTILMDILWLMEIRTNILMENHFSSIKSYNRSNKEKWPHLFIIIDEGFKVIRNYDVQVILDRILDCGEPLGIHLIYATNAYLKDYSSFINKFKYRMSFDMASLEQAKYIDIKKANWLKDNGEAIIKGKDTGTYKFQAPFVSSEEIQKVVLEVGKK